MTTSRSDLETCLVCGGAIRIFAREDLGACGMCAAFDGPGAYEQREDPGPDDRADRYAHGAPGCEGESYAGPPEWGRR